MAATTPDRSHPSWLAIRAPPENPVAYTRAASMQRSARSVLITLARNATSLGALAGTAPPPKSGCPGTFQSYPDPDGIAPCGYATTKPSRSEAAFIPVSATCCAAVEPEPCMLSTSGTIERSVNPDGRWSSTGRLVPPDAIDTTASPGSAWPLQAVVGRVV